MSYTVIRNVSLTAIAFLLMAMVYSCRNPGKYLVNSWRVEKLQTGTDFSQSPKHAEVFKEFEEHARFEFHADGTYSFDFAGSVQKGKWKFDKRKMTLTTVDENGKETISKVLELKPDKLVIEQQEATGVKNVLTLAPKTASH